MLQKLPKKAYKNKSQHSLNGGSGASDLGGLRRFSAGQGLEAGFKGFPERTGEGEGRQVRTCGTVKISSFGEKAGNMLCGRPLHLGQRAGRKHYRPVGLGETMGPPMRE